MFARFLCTVAQPFVKLLLPLVIVDLTKLPSYAAFSCLFQDNHDIQLVE